MEQIIVSIVLVIFVMLGVIYTVRSIAMLIMKPPADYDYSIIIPISGHCEDIEYLARSVMERSSWCGGKGSLEIILLNCGADSETLELCNRICEQHDDLLLLDSDNINSYFCI